MWQIQWVWRVIIIHLSIQETTISKWNKTAVHSINHKHLLPWWNWLFAFDFVSMSLQQIPPDEAKTQGQTLQSQTEIWRWNHMAWWEDKKSRERIVLVLSFSSKGESALGCLRWSSNIESFYSCLVCILCPLNNTENCYLCPSVWSRICQSSSRGTVGADIKLKVVNVLLFLFMLRRRSLS